MVTEVAGEDVDPPVDPESELGQISKKVKSLHLETPSWSQSSILTSTFRFWTYCMQQRTDSKCLKVKKLLMQMSQMNIEPPIFIIFPSHHHCLINSTVYMYSES